MSKFIDEIKTLTISAQDAYNVSVTLFIEEEIKKIKLGIQEAAKSGYEYYSHILSSNLNSHLFANYVKQNYVKNKKIIGHNNGVSIESYIILILKSKPIFDGFDITWNYQANQHPILFRWSN